MVDHGVAVSHGDFRQLRRSHGRGSGQGAGGHPSKDALETEARRLRADGTEELVPAAQLSKGDLVVCEANDLIPSDGEIIEGIASVDESAITGESRRLSVSRAATGRQ